MEKIRLSNGVEIPLMGYGVFQITDENVCEKGVLAALEAGCRLIDTAACYGNEKAVGEAIRKSSVDRKDIFVTSKVWIQDSGYEKTIKSFEKSLENLHTNYLDLYLVHMPYGDYYGSWRAMEDLYRAGRIKAIGVCNFLEDRLEDLILSHDIKPVINQIELHPYCQQERLRKYMKEQDIQPMAWAPFAEGQNDIFNAPVLKEIGAKYGKTPAQVILRFLNENNIVAIPKSVHEDRIKENLTIEDFELSAEDRDKICGLDTGKPLILDIRSIDEVKRLHSIRFEQ